MRILAIRGENLASLAGRFEVDFDTAPLRDAGLFAIVGPTGSGKSTLLDALCLALYDRTPRLSGQGGHRLGRIDADEGLKSNDARNIVRHGCAQAWAEVDFKSGDGAVLTARWQVARARRKAHGRIQKQSLELRCGNSGRVVASGKKTEVLDEIKARIGLEFDQFRRSVLLAQGDFAAFLKADAKEKAELLERMTGTEIYAAVSRQAYSKLDEERKKLEILETRRGSVPVLEDTERAELERRKVELDAERQSLEEKLKVCSENVSGFETALELKKKLEENREICAALDRKLTEDRAALGEVEQDLAKLESRFQEAKRAAEKVEAPLKEARRLDDAIARTKAVEKQRRQELKERKNELQHVQKVLQDVSDGFERAGSEQQKLEKWLNDHPGEVSLEKEADRLCDSVRACLNKMDKLESAELEFQVASKEQARSDRELGGVRGREEKVAGELAELEHEVEQAQALAARFDRDELTSERKEAERLAELLRRVGEALNKAEELTVRRQDKRGALEDEKRTQKETSQELRRLEREIAGTEAAGREATRAWEDARAFRDLETERKRLQAGRPCPLCGSKQHPWAETSFLGEHVDARKARVDELEVRVKAQVQARARAEEKMRTANQAIGLLEQDLAGLDEDIAEHDGFWADLAEQLPSGERDSLKGAGAKRRLEELQKKNDTRIEQLERREAEVFRREKQARLKGEAAAAKRVEREKLRSQRETLERGTEAVRRRCAVAEATKSQLEEEVESDRGFLLDELSKYGGIFGRDNRILDGIAERIAEIAGRVRETARGTEVARSERARLEPKLAAGFEKASLLEQTVRASADELDRCLEELARLTEARGDLFEGRSADAVEKESRDGIAEAEAALKKRLGQRQELREKIADMRGRLSSLSDQARILEDELAGLSANLSSTCGRLGVPCELAAVRDEREKKLQALEENRDGAAAAKARLDGDVDARKRIGQLAEQIGRQKETMRVWEVLGELIASKDGAKFRKYAQSVTLDNLVAHANEHLRDLARRYVVQRVPGDELELQVVDTEMGDEVRAASSLSGGETFLVSLSLALGLASMASSRVAVESLFVDEGFGTLDSRTLDVALSALETLRDSGRQVGIISHVPGLAEQLGARVEVVKTGPGKSAVRVVSSLLDMPQN